MCNAARSVATIALPSGMSNIVTQGGINIGGGSGA